MKEFTKNAQITEYDKILARLAALTHTEGGKERALSLRPLTERGRIERLLTETDEAKGVSAEKGAPSFSGGREVSTVAERAQKGAQLSTRELLDVAGLLSCVRGLSAYFDGCAERYPALCGIFSRLAANRSLENAITRAIAAEDQIADDASPTLAGIRRKMRKINDSIREELQGYIKNGAHSRYLQDNIVTMRGGRYVIPVKAEYKNEVKGLLHETSATGATMFIEPIAVVEANNDLRILEGEEKEEIDRILTELSAQVSEFGRQLTQNCRTVGLLDFIFAKAELSVRMRGERIAFTDERIIELRSARHPLLDRKTVVPITVRVGGEYDTLVITGPNTGGKTVALKTLGLFAMMAQSGLHLPCSPDSRTCVFSCVLADIGDEQSIEQSLSTFSAHMKRIIEILAAADEKALVLFDELGSGTDPVEGAALATSIIEQVREQGALCAATTHYAELKAYALDTEGVCNASCEFDIETLKPTYRLIIGTPGKSNAFAISGRLGLSPAVIARAQSYVSADDSRFERVIEKLERSRIAMDETLAAAKKERADVEAYKAQEQARMDALVAQTEKEIARARAEAASLVKSAQATSESVLAELKELQRKRESEHLAGELEQARRKIRHQLRKTDLSIQPIAQDEEYRPSRPIRKGDEVFLKNVGKRGTVTAEPDAKGNVTVQTGLLTTRTKVDNLVLAEDRGLQFTDKSGKTVPARSYRPTMPKSFSPELDLRGQNGEDAWALTDKYLDDAVMAGMHQVTLIHGKGTGALRARLQELLRGDARVSSFRGGKYGEGDAGVTVVELK